MAVAITNRRTLKGKRQSSRSPGQKSRNPRRQNATVVRMGIGRSVRNSTTVPCRRCVGDRCLRARWSEVGFELEEMWNGGEVGKGTVSLKGKVTVDEAWCASTRGRRSFAGSVLVAGACAGQVVVDLRVGFG